MAIWTNFEVDIYTPTVGSVSIEIAGQLVEINSAGLQVIRNDTRYVKIDKGGNSSTMLWVGGDIRATGNITAYASSDERLKENIIPIESALDKIEKINGVYFDWTDEYINMNGGEDGFFVRKHDVGVIAQEIEKVLPEITNIRDDGYKAVQYEKIIPLLIQSIKELYDEVKKLKK